MPPKTRTTSRKPAPRKTTARKPPAKTPASNVLQLDRAENVERYEAMLADREPLFSIDGVEYTVPKQVPMAWSMKTLDLATAQGDVAALDYAVSVMVGPEGYEALLNCKTLMPEDMNTLFRLVMDKVLPGGSYIPKASATNGVNGSPS